MASAIIGVKRPFAAMATVGPSSNGDSHDARAVRSRSSTDSAPDDFSALPSAASTPPRRATHGTARAATGFEPHASIVLMGTSGSGKSTLAVMAATALKRRIVDTAKVFYEATGLTTGAYKKTHGTVDYQRRIHSLLHHTLVSNARDCIIVTSWVDRAALALLQDFATSHPVIHIVRDAAAIRDYLRITDDDKLREILQYSFRAFRSAMNHEFFNVSEKLVHHHDEPSHPIEAKNNDPKPSAPYLTLKRAERHFLKFLSLVMPKGAIPFHDSAFPLARVPLESRKHTYVLTLPLSRLLEEDLDVEALEEGADAIEIVIDDLYTLDTSTHSVPPREHSHLCPERLSQISIAVARIRRSTVIPIIYHVSWPAVSAHSTLTAGQVMAYLEHLQHGLKLCPEFFTVDIRLESALLTHLVAHRGASKVIATAHLADQIPPAWTEPIWISFYQKAHAIGADLVRFTRPALSAEDNHEVAKLRYAIDMLPNPSPSSPKPPLSAYNTGTRGRHSAVTNLVLSAVRPSSWPEPSENESIMSTCPSPTITVWQLNHALHTSFINDSLKLYVVGSHVSYSLSPAMHNSALKACGINHTYSPYTTNSLNTLSNLVHDPYFAGASIGLPFKVEVISLTHSLSAHARAIGAVNTLIPIRRLNPDGSVPDDMTMFFNWCNRSGPVLALYGENTDWVGIRAVIRRGLSPANAVRPGISSGLVIGAGGMARAAVYSMLQLGVTNIAIYNRTRSRAEKLVSHFTTLIARNDLPLLTPRQSPSASGHDDGTDASEPVRFHILGSRDEKWPEHKFPRHPTMIVSCIPTHSTAAGASPNFTLPEDWLLSPTGGVVIEYAYKDVNTPLLRQTRAASEKGWVAMDGLDLLPDQGFAQFELFTGRRAPRRLMREEVFRAYPGEGGADGSPDTEDGQDGKKANERSVYLQPRLAKVADQGCS